MKMVVDIAHDLLEEYISKDKIAVDFTMGNGNDTLFLAQKAKHVYAFDVQSEAIENTRIKLANHAINNVTLIHDGHENCAEYLTKYHCGIFNLGYLPKANHVVTTMLETTMVAVKWAIDLLLPQGRLVIVCYPGHEEGKKEADYLENFVMNMDPHDFECASYRMMNRKNAPYILIIDKKY